MVARSDTPPEPFHWVGCHDQTQQRSCSQVIYVRRRCPCSESLLSPLPYRIKEELGGSERCQEAVTIGWQRFKQLTGQFSSGHIDSSCYLSSFLNLFPNDPHRRHTEVKRLSAHFDDYTLCCACVTLFQAALRYASRACDDVSKQQRRSASSVRIYLSLHVAFAHVAYVPVVTALQQIILLCFAVICTLFGRLVGQVMLRLPALPMLERPLLPLLR